ncbi:MAG: DUF4139 domain-containing protein [Planctomycetaceae bacterium]|jgi:hypothetical protein|nr:DUF4139 domain-containing protein [Planctomycetaceae bacterium]
MLRIYFVVVLSFCLTGLNVTGNEIEVSAVTPSVALFKNGVTVVRQEIDVPAPGVYCWNEVPSVIHGTFFVESDLNIEIRTTQRLVTLPIDEKNPQQGIADLTGKLVTVHFSDTEKSAVQGKLLDNTVPPKPNSLLPDFSATLTNRNVYPYSIPGSLPNSVRNFETPLKLETADKKYLFLTGAQISYIETNEPVTERTECRPVMLFQATAKDGKTAGKIRLFYLIKGATWAPSYRIDLLNEKQLRVEQSAQIRNEWSPIRDTEISLVSGFPQIESSQILSPLSPSQTLERFFQQITSQHANRNRRNNDGSFMSNAIMTQQAVVPYSVANTGFDTTALAAGEGPDIHYNNIGKKTLEVGDTLSLSTGKGETDYRRFLESDLVSVVRNYYDQYYNNRATDRFLTPDVFDVLKFPNPLPFPMTTAPATVTEKGRFLGQSQSNWVNPGQIASVNITKVMNVRVSYSEEAEDIGIKTPNAGNPATSPTFHQFRGYRYVIRPVTGTIEITNQRNEEITLHLSGVFLYSSGELKIEPVTTKQSISTKDYLPNDLMDLFWELQLKPGEKKTITVSGIRWFRT